MNFKIIFLIALTLSFIWNVFIKILEYRSDKNPIPASAADIYDETAYLNWVDYNHRKAGFEIFKLAAGFVLTAVLILLDAYAHFASLFGANVYLQILAVVLFSEITSAVVMLPFEYHDTMKIEGAFGFNRSTLKVFIIDEIRDCIISFALDFGLSCALAGIHRSLGDLVVVLFACVLIAFMLALTFLYPFIMRIANKFTPLEDGELKDSVTALLEKNGYHVREILVMDASKRSTKSNAYFTGFGKTKTIVLYDTLVAAMTPEEICAVFAHEMGHGLHHDTLRLRLLSFLSLTLMAVLVWLDVRYPAIFASFGFDSVNYGFASLLMTTEMGLVSPLFGLITNGLSRKAEYRADAQAVKEGYGEALIHALKKLARENFSNLSPSPISVKLEYSHPTIAQRIDRILTPPGN